VLLEDVVTGERFWENERFDSEEIYYYEDFESLSMEVDASGCYRFSIIDEDGTCCFHNHGSFGLYLDRDMIYSSDALVFSGEESSDHESFVFGAGCNENSVVASPNVPTIPSASSANVPTPRPFVPPTPRPVPPPTPRPYIYVPPPTPRPYIYVPPPTPRPVARPTPRPVTMPPVTVSPTNTPTAPKPMYAVVTLQLSTNTWPSGVEIQLQDIVSGEIPWGTQDVESQEMGSSTSLTVDRDACLYLQMVDWAGAGGGSFSLIYDGVLVFSPTNIPGIATKFLGHGCKEMLPLSLYDPASSTFNISLELFTDSFPEENYVYLGPFSPTDPVDAVMQNNFWEYERFDAENRITLTQAVDPSECYRFSIYDSAGNGLSRTHGSFTLTYGDYVVFFASGDDFFKDEATMYLGSRCDSYASYGVSSFSANIPVFGGLNVETETAVPTPDSSSGLGSAVVSIP